MMTDVTINLPEEFSLRMKQQIGDEFPEFEKSLQSPSPTSIRHNPKKKVEIDGEPIPWSNQGKYLDKRPVFTLDPAFHAGSYYVQEPSSMMLEQAFTQLDLLSKPIRILDLCAAPGGKSTHILSMIHPDSLLVSNEVIQSRAKVLVENITKWGYINQVVTNNDAHDFQYLQGFFDVIVVDAPCSGEGLFRKDPHAMNEWSVGNVMHCAKRQKRILNDIWPALKTGGILIYCTCTYNPSENEETIKWLTEQHLVESMPLQFDKEWGVEEVSIKNSKGYQLYPHRVKGEGFFLSALKKNEAQQEIHIKSKKESSDVPKIISEHIHEWILNPESASFHIHMDSIYMINKALRAERLFLQNYLKIISSGTSVATRKGTKLIPDHAMALSILLNRQNFQSIELDLDESLAYLKKENITAPDLKKGYALVTYKSLGLGWLNVLDNRTNNLYPKEWRIRMRLN